MAEYIDNGSIAVKSGEVLPLEVTNKCDNPFSVGTGLIFNEDGQYLVTVYGRKIIVEKFSKVKHSKWDNTCSCENCGCQPWYSGDIHSMNYCPKCGAKMDLE